MVLVKDRRISDDRWIWSETGKEIMQVPPEIIKCVAFLAVKEPDKYRFIGTIFFIGKPYGGVSGGSQTTFVYGVTAKHVIDNLLPQVDELYMRFNRIGGNAGWIAVPLDAFRFHETDTSVDLAVIPFGLPEFLDHMVIPLEMILTPEEFKAEGYGIGDEIFVTGLFHPHRGEKRNIPILRVGNLAALVEEKVYTEGFGLIDAYLVECRSIGGLSGSPVFIHSGIIRSIDGKVVVAENGIKFSLLGVMHGHWDRSAAIVDTHEDSKSVEKINMGIAIVVPTEKLLEVLNQPSLLELERQQTEAARRANAPAQDLK